MQRGASRRSSPRSNRSTTGSIWETRMKLDEVKGGIKVFTGEENHGEDEDPISLRSYNLRLRRNKSEGGGGDRRKRKNWSPPETGKIQSLNSPKIDEETKEIELEIKERRKSFDDKEIDQICDRSLSSTEDPENTPDKQDLDLEIEASPPLMAASSCIVLPPESPLVPLQVEAVTEAQYRMQSIVDLIMWREIPRTAFVFGTGSFLLLSSSYTKDLNFRQEILSPSLDSVQELMPSSCRSLVSVLSYVGLVYLASIFFFNSILRRGTRDSEEKDSRSMMGEEEAIRIARLLLPYVNELLVNLKALFSGDPETTMKLALILFVLARCGGSITCWSMAKMAFFGVFTIPKICASYSVQLGCFGKFWTERAKDAWDSCQHKKAVATGLFALVWNLSSAFARIWAVFMLLVAVRLYQQRAAAAAAEEEEGGEAAVEEKPHRQSVGPPASSEKKRWS